MDLEKQKVFIKDNAMSLPLKRIATIIGRSSTFVKNEMTRQGILVPQHIRDKFRKDSCFQKGSTPFNKGIPQADWMPTESINKTKKSRFKKGNLPHNTREDFDISLRKDKQKYAYYYIRIKKAKWILYHRWLWEQAYGDIPQGFNIQFKDGDTLNCDLSNLYMIDRSNQVVINKNGGNRIPFELQETILLIKDLKNKIYEKQSD